MMRNFINKIAALTALLLAIATFWVSGVETTHLQSEAASLRQDVSRISSERDDYSSELDTHRSLSTHYRDLSGEMATSLASSEQTNVDLRVFLGELVSTNLSLRRQRDAVISNLDDTLIDLTAALTEADSIAELASARGAELAEYVRTFGPDIHDEDDEPSEEKVPGVLATAGGFWSSAWSALTAGDVVVGMPSAQASGRQGVK